MQTKLRYSMPLVAAALLTITPLPAANAFARVDDCFSGYRHGTSIDGEVFDPAHDVPTDVLSPSGGRDCVFTPLGEPSRPAEAQGQ